MGLPLEKLTLPAFLEWENAQETRNEFYRGDIFARVGARRAHGTVVSNLVRHLGNALDGSPCRVFHEGMQVQVADEAILYPDVFVTCDKADLDDIAWKLNTRPRKSLGWKCPAELFLPASAFDFKSHWANKLNLVALGH